MKAAARGARAHGRVSWALGLLVLLCAGEKSMSLNGEEKTPGSARSRLKLLCRRRGGLWGEEGGKAAAGEFLGQGAHRWERNYWRRRAEQQEKRV